MVLPELIEKIKKLHWVMDWTGNWPLLDAMMQNDEAYVRESKKICGIILIAKEVEFNENRVCTMYRTEEDAEAQAHYFREKFKHDGAFLKRSARFYRLKVNRDLRALRNRSSRRRRAARRHHRSTVRA